jgi:hypothetical protein
MADLYIQFYRFFGRLVRSSMPPHDGTCITWELGNRCIDLQLP